VLLGIWKLTIANRALRFLSQVRLSLTSRLKAGRDVK